MGLIIFLAHHLDLEKGGQTKRGQATFPHLYKKLPIPFIIIILPGQEGPLTWGPSHFSS
jgi:uncharacterized protein (DUF952 family)